MKIFGMAESYRSALMLNLRKMELFEITCGGVIQSSVGKQAFGNSIMRKLNQIIDSGIFET